jgi:hypothetical protein
MAIFTRKRVGIALLILGFLWIAWDAAFSFADDQHGIWIWTSQNMPPGDTLTRAQASASMRQLSLALKDRHRVIVIPALLMLGGGLAAALSRPRSENEKRPG